MVSADSPDNIQLTIPADNQTDIAQWFHFRLESTSTELHQFSILDLAKSAIRKVGRITMLSLHMTAMSGSVSRLNLMAIPYAFR